MVTMADEGYGACALRLIRSIRGVGRWGGSVLVLAPFGAGSRPLMDSTVESLRDLHAQVFQVPPETAGGAEVRGAGSAVQYAKNALLVDGFFRRYESILFLDADGVVEAPVQPLLMMPLPDGRPIALPTWPSTVVRHESLYTREIHFGALSAESASQLRAVCPDRNLVGITAWFLLKPQRLPPIASMRREVQQALEKWRVAFRFNDQGLWNILFYNTSAFFPLCLSGPKPQSTLGAPSAEPFLPLIVDSLSGLASAIDTACGPGHKRRRPMYVHGLKDCISQEEWERKRRSTPAVPPWRVADLKS